MNKLPLLRTFRHPLIASNLKTFTKVVKQSGGIPVKHWPHIALMTSIILARFPITILERFYTALTPECEISPPIFIIGHWRSGTTHLYNILSKGEFGFVPPIATGLPWEMLSISSLFKPILKYMIPPDRYIDSMPVYPDSPQEDEIGISNMTPLSFYHGLYFPKNLEKHFNQGVFFDDLNKQQINEWQNTLCYFYKKLSIQQKHKQLLIKNPVYTARVSLLRQIFPNAKFIHIYRNPYKVFISTKNLYEKLLDQYALQDYTDVDIENHILKTYPRMMQAAINDCKHLPDKSFIEIRYEELIANPMQNLEKIYQQLEVNGFAAAKPKFISYLNSIKDYQKNKFNYPSSSMAAVKSHWHEILDHFNYNPKKSS